MLSPQVITLGSLISADSHVSTEALFCPSDNILRYGHAPDDTNCILAYDSVWILRCHIRRRHDAQSAAASSALPRLGRPLSARALRRQLGPSVCRDIEIWPLVRDRRRGRPSRAPSRSIQAYRG